MPPDLPNEQELTLKKRARRRLVGAIALVLLMVIVLPRILQDRAAIAQQEAIKITMPSVDSQQEPIAVDGAAASKVDVPQEPVVAAVPELVQPEVGVAATETVVAENEISDAVMTAKNAADVNKAELEKSVAKPEKKLEVKTDKPASKVSPHEVKPSEPKANNVKPSEAELVETKPVNEPKAAEVKKVVESKPAKSSAGGFMVQVGVYSDAGNVKRLQAKIKELGYSSHTESITTPKGEKIRLKAGSFSTRADAVQAQAKLQKIGLAGMVVGND